MSFISNAHELNNAREKAGPQLAFIGNYRIAVFNESGREVHARLTKEANDEMTFFFCSEVDSTHPPMRFRIELKER